MLSINFRISFLHSLREETEILKSLPEFPDLVCHVHMSQEKRPAAVPVNTETVQDMFGILPLCCPFLVLFPVLPHGLPARHAPYWYYHESIPCRYLNPNKLNLYNYCGNI